MKIHEILEDEKFKKELKDAFDKIKVRKGHPTTFHGAPHNDKKKRMKKGYEKHKGKKVDYYA